MTPLAIIQPSLFYREIPLTQGQVALVDVEDYGWLMGWKWQAAWSKPMKSFYACRHGRVDGRSTTILMHREILGLKHGDKRFGDHRESGQTLDNRRHNLRIATCGQNRGNSRLPCTNTSGFKGVTYRADANRWEASIHLKTGGKYLGRYSNPEAAHAAYLRAAQEAFGEFSRSS